MKPSDLLWRQWTKTWKGRPSRVVWIEAETGREWRADDLNEHMASFQATLSKLRAGQRVAFRLPNGPDWMALFLALQQAKLGAIPLDAGLPAEGCFETARRLGADALFLDGSFHCLKSSKIPKRHSFFSCLKVTSGSYGQPKGIECQAGHLLADGRHVAATMKITPRDRNFAAIPLGHSYGLGNLVMPLILQGTAVVTAREYVPRQLTEWIVRYGVTVLPLVPALARVLAALPGTGSLGKMRTVISAGAILSPEVAEAFFQRYGRKIHNFYGSSETGGICYDRNGSASRQGCSVGVPLEGVKVQVKSGKVVVSSAAVATSTRNFTLPDIGAWNEAGELVLLGRRSQAGNIGGKKLHPREIEEALRKIGGVREARTWLDHVGGRDVLCAAVETDLPEAEIAQKLSAKLPAWKMPRRMLVEVDLPRTERGKLDTAELRRRMA